jgi:hypothetical protein
VPTMLFPRFRRVEVPAQGSLFHRHHSTSCCYSTPLRRDLKMMSAEGIDVLFGVLSFRIQHSSLIIFRSIRVPSVPSATGAPVPRVHCGRS